MGRAGVHVFRISGPLAGPVLDDMTGRRGDARVARLTDVRLHDGTVLDQGLALWFPGPSSFTGEDTAELHLHGSVAVERGLTEALIRRGLVPASAGAFTLRAFENGKLDLAQAEGLADLLSAETDGQRRQALGQLGGRLSELAAGWRAELLAISALLTAAIDFSDEEDVPDGVDDGVHTRIEALVSEMREALSGAEQARRLRDGVRVVLTGPPNAGKSSLLNALSASDQAIVSDVPGTTRDVIEVRMEREGRLIVLVDTAGMRDTADQVERIGVERARRAAASADLQLVLEPLATVREPALEDGRIYVATKRDLSPNVTAPDGWITTSATTVGGTVGLLAAIDARLGETDAGVLTRGRHIDLVRSAAEALASCGGVQAPELVAAGLQTALTQVRELVGDIHVEEVLGAVFAEFCVGK